MITLKNISFAYRWSTPVLKSLSMDVHSGHIYGLLGKNGEGKTTLLNILSGQLFPNKGECSVLGEIPSQRTANFLQQIFLLPEEIRLPDVTAQQYIEMYAPFYPTFREDILKSCFESFEIVPNQKISDMSFGKKKGVAISLSLSANTSVLLMDEPINGLDIPAKTAFRKLIASYTGEHQITIISTHLIRELENLIDSVIVLDNKQILLNSPLEEISKKLFFRSIKPGENILYSESSPLGLIGVGENKENEETAISLEMLFQTTISRPQEIKRIFNC